MSVAEVGLAWGLQVLLDQRNLRSSYSLLISRLGATVVKLSLVCIKYVKKNHLQISLNSWKIFLLIGLLRDSTYFLDTSRSLIVKLRLQITKRARYTK